MRILVRTVHFRWEFFRECIEFKLGRKKTSLPCYSIVEDLKFFLTLLPNILSWKYSNTFCSIFKNGLDTTLFTFFTI